MKIYFFVPLALLLAYFISKTTPLGDFAGYYFGSWELWNGDFKTAYDTALLNLAILEKGYTGVFVSYTPFPPFTALAMAPFLWMPVGVAKLVFNIVSAGLFLGSVYRAFKAFAVPAWVALALPLVFFFPFRNNVLLGQSYLLLTVLLLEGFMAYKKGRMVLAAVLWSFAMVFKIFPVILLFYLLTNKNYRQFWYCMAGCVGWGLISVLCTGIDAWWYYVFTLMPRLNNGELNDAYTYVFQSAFMLLKNLFVYDAAQNTGVWVNSAVAFVVLNAFYKASIIAMCIKKNDFGVWILGSLLISPNGSSYSLVLMIIPLLFLERRHVVMGLLLLACNVPLMWFGEMPVLLQYPRLWLLLAVFVLMVWGVQVPVKLAAMCFVLFLLMVRLPQPDDGGYLLKGPSPLIYDFKVQQGKLVYYYIDGSGKHEVVREEPVKKLFLSDRNRGVGFYTLKYVDDAR